MPILTSADYTMIRQKIRANSEANTAFKAWGLDRPAWYDLFQTLEDWYFDGFLTRPATSSKVALNAVTSITNTQAQIVSDIWMEFHASRNP